MDEIMITLYKKNKASFPTYPMFKVEIEGEKTKSMRS